MVLKMPKKPTYKELEQRIRELERSEIDNEKTEATLRANEEIQNHTIKKNLNSILARLQLEKDIFPVNN
jgi:hypothetical protein